jgi:hypothetical protein
MGPEPSKAVAWHYRSCPDAAVAVTTVELHREQRIRRLGSAVCHEWLVVLGIEVRIIEIDVRQAVRLGREYH